MSKQNKQQEESMKKLFPNGFEKQTVKITDSPYHTDLKGKNKDMSKTTAQAMIKRGWAKALVIGILILMVAGIGIDLKAQAVSRTFYNSEYPTAATDTVTNGGTAVIDCAHVTGGGTTTTIVAKVVENTGTTAGTLVLWGCIICTGSSADWQILVAPNSVTALGTRTALDVATGYYGWWLTGSPYNQYRIVHTGTGTMAAKLSGYLVKK
jgi:hypothetical protein